MLTQHLREMEKDGLVVRKDLSGRSRHVEYSLSDSKGFAALHLISTLRTWGREYGHCEANAPERLGNRATRIVSVRSSPLARRACLG